MKDWFDTQLAVWLAFFALPKVGLSTVFVVSFLSATLLPMGSEVAVFALLKVDPGLFWPVMLVATAGNTLGGALSWWMGWAAVHAKRRLRPGNSHPRALQWLQRFGPKACLLSWLPAVGDPLCAVAGWLNLPFWPCVAYMAIGKFVRYVAYSALLLWVFPGQLPI
jgi:membrane protein YqaA with SNARE-associated domain